MELYNEDQTGLTVSPKLKADLLQAANWAKIIVITAWITSVLSVIVNVSKNTKLAFVSGFISIGLSILIYIFLFKFGSEVKKGIDNNDQEMFNTGLFSLRTYFKIVSLLLIIALGITFIVILFMFFFMGRK